MDSVRACALELILAGVAVAGLTSCSQYSFHQNSPTPPGSTPPAPSQVNTPHLYVATYQQSTSGTASAITSTYGFSVADDGELAAVEGFPLPYALSGVIAGNYLFGADGMYIDTYKINADGTVAKAQSYEDTQASAQACPGCTPGMPVMADRTGTHLYATAGYLDGGDYKSRLQTFEIDPGTGAIRYVSSDIPVSARDWGQTYVAFSGNGAFLYGVNLTIFSTSLTFAAVGPQGSLSPGHISGPLLNGVPSGQMNSWAIGADTTNHVLAGLQQADYDGNPVGPLRLASFTINSDGTLTTTNTSADMPVAPGGPESVSPDGNLIAVADAKGGIQLFRFNGAAPVTAMGPMLSTDRISQMGWDRGNHLFALSSTHHLYVFEVSANGASAAPGSPHSIPNASGLLVQP